MMLKYLCQIHLWTAYKLNTELCTCGFSLVKCYLLKYKKYNDCRAVKCYLKYKKYNHSGLTKSESLKLNCWTTGIFWNPSQLFLSYKCMTSCPFKTTTYFDVLVSTLGSDEGVCIIYDPWMSGVFPVALKFRLLISWQVFLSSTSVRYDQVMC